jgi:acetyl-CoA C-acetyltransferase
VAMAGNEPTLLADMLAKDQLGRQVTVAQRSGKNVFQPL